MLDSSNIKAPLRYNRSNKIEGTIINTFNHKAHEAFPDRTYEEILAFQWTAIQNEKYPMSSDEEVIEKMKEIEEVYLENYTKLSEYKEQNRILQKELEKIL